MGAACCKRLEPESPTTSPHLPFCEVVRRCARLICPVDPPQQKPVYSTRKYGLSDIVGPVHKKDSWVQTDPLPPPRRRKRKDRQRRRSRSVEFLPYLIRRGSSKASRTSGSLEDISGQEDALDFQMFFMGRLPGETFGDGKDTLPGRKKEFLSGLLGEENNNFVFDESDDKIQTALKKEEDIPNNAVQGEEKNRRSLAPEISDPDLHSLGESNSRRSSITESLREFESSLLDMLEEDDCSLTKDTNLFMRDLNKIEDSDNYVQQLRKTSLTPLKEEKEEDYVITPLEDEQEEKAIIDGTAITKINGLNQSKTDNDSISHKSNGEIVNTSSLDEIKDEIIINSSLEKNDNLSNQQLKDLTPAITIEIVS